MGRLQEAGAHGGGGGVQKLGDWTGPSEEAEKAQDTPPWCSAQMQSPTLTGGSPEARLRVVSALDHGLHLHAVQLKSGRSD